MQIESPCIGVCALDENDVCMGCFRTADDITEWSIYSDAEKAEANRVAAERAVDAGMTF
ncbi:MAG: DUF1289 domain-containing protein [Gammaproteobacteria bacterium]|jgi:hypothetical protein|nr:DUF1289 domain-containing protein [Gammaproteobacteria bacterium]